VRLEFDAEAVPYGGVLSVSVPDAARKGQTYRVTMEAVDGLPPRCPFCGGRARVVESPPGMYAHTYWRVDCGLCGCGTPPCDTREEALFKWRQRDE